MLIYFINTKYITISVFSYLIFNLFFFFLTSNKGILIIIMNNYYLRVSQLLYDYSPIFIHFQLLKSHFTLPILIN